MTPYMLVNRTRVAQFVGDFPDRASAIAALGLPEDGVKERDLELDNEPRVWLTAAHPQLPRDGDNDDHGAVSDTSSSIPSAVAGGHRKAWTRRWWDCPAVIRLSLLGDHGRRSGFR